MSVEQIIRDVLEAVKEDKSLFRMFTLGADPQTFTAADLIIPANRLQKILANNQPAAATVKVRFKNRPAAKPELEQEMAADHIPAKG
jgi:hypothetical protein